MDDVGSSVLAKLKNKAKETGKSNQLCMQLFCQEEFLRRLSVSEYSDNFVLKGGLFLYTLTGFDSRVTVDVDFMLRKLPNTPEKLSEVIKEIIGTKTDNDFISFELKSIMPISINKEYPGIHADIVAYIKNTRTPFGIDFGVGDIIIPGTVKRKIPTQLSEFGSPTVNTYSLETTVAEKFDAILNLMEFSSRMKDYYDIYYLANKFDFDGATLTEALKRTFDNRSRRFTSDRFEHIIKFDSDKEMLKKWTAFCKKADLKTDNFRKVIQTINIFLAEPFEAAVKNTDFTARWTAFKSEWKQNL